jgi:hypothetical protein
LGEVKIMEHTKLMLKRQRASAEKDPPSIDKEPFYAWECVTLYLTNKTLDFVFDNPESLFIFINFI